MDKWIYKQFHYSMLDASLNLIVKHRHPHDSTTPILHYSNTPSIHHSNIHVFEVKFK